MDRIEYKMLFKITDHKGAIMNRMLNSRSFHVYLIFHILLLITIVILAEVYVDSIGGDLLSILFVVCLAALAVPFSVPGHRARTYIKVYNKYGEALYFMDKEKCGFKSDLFQTSLKWEMFTSIYETKKYIFMKRIDGQSHVIFKTCLPDETVMAIKKILANTPIEDKQMLPEEELSKS